MATYFNSFQEPELAPKSTLTEKVGRYVRGVEAIKEVHACIERCCELADIRKKYERYPSDLRFDLEHALKEHRKAAWRDIIDGMKVQEACSAKRWREITGQIEKGDVPEFTEDNIGALCRSFAQDLSGYFKEACAEVLEWLRPGCWEGDYKTNQKNARMEIGPKLVKTCVMDCYGLGVSHGERDILRSLHSVFKMLDGKGAARYPDDLPTQINALVNENRRRGVRGVTEYKNEYFRCVWFKNRNMHIEILRADLLAEFNSIVHGNTLREPRKEELHAIVTA